MSQLTQGTLNVVIDDRVVEKCDIDLSVEFNLVVEPSMAKRFLVTKLNCSKQSMTSRLLSSFTQIQFLRELHLLACAGLQPRAPTTLDIERDTLAVKVCQEA